MRGRLINPFQVAIYVLDTIATNADPDGSGALTSGYDSVFREPRKIPVTGQTSGKSARLEKPLPMLLAQVETLSLEKQKQLAQGNAPVADLILVIHYTQLEELGLIDILTGRATIGVGARLAEIRHRSSGALERAFPDPPGAFAVRVEDEFGGWTSKRNLLKVYFKDRQQGVDV